MQRRVAYCELAVITDHAWRDLLDARFDRVKLQRHHQRGLLSDVEYERALWRANEWVGRLSTFYGAAKGALSVW